MRNSTSALARAVRVARSSVATLRVRAIGRAVLEASLGMNNAHGMVVIPAAALQKHRYKAGLMEAKFCVLNWKFKAFCSTKKNIC